MSRAAARHLTAEDVDELRELVKAGATQETPRPGHSRVAGARDLRSADTHLHRAELVHREGRVAPREALLAKDDGPGLDRRTTRATPTSGDSRTRAVRATMRSRARRPLEMAPTRRGCSAARRVNPATRHPVPDATNTVPNMVSAAFTSASSPVWKRRRGHVGHARLPIPTGAKGLHERVRLEAGIRDRVRATLVGLAPRPDVDGLRPVRERDVHEGPHVRSGVGSGAVIGPGVGQRLARLQPHRATPPTRGLVPRRGHGLVPRRAPGGILGARRRPGLRSMTSRPPCAVQSRRPERRPWILRDLSSCAFGARQAQARR